MKLKRRSKLSAVFSVCTNTQNHRFQITEISSACIQEEVITVCLIFIVLICAVYGESNTNSPAYPDTTDSTQESNTDEMYVDNITESYVNSSDENGTEINLLFNNTHDSITTDDSMTEEPLRPGVQILNFDVSMCTCDLKGDVCEVNCCCDEDCDEDDFKVFTDCLPQGPPYDSKYCYHENIFYKNNTVYKGVREGANQLFCIVTDNLKKKMQFKDIPVYTDMEDFNQLNLQVPFTWELGSESDKTNFSEVRKAGDIMFIMPIDYERKEFQWNLPDHCFGNICDCEQPVHYMEDASSSCIRVISDLEAECEKDLFLSAATYANFCFSEFPETLTETPYSIDNVTEDTTFQYTSTQREESNILCILSDNQPTPMFDSSADKCHNVVSQVKYELWHEGSSGVKRAAVSFAYTSLNMSSKSLTQTFFAHFHWNKTQMTNSQRRSGNPGYIFGLPLIAGVKISNSNTMKILDNGLAIFKSDSNGFCSQEQQTIYFGKNVKSGCLIEKLTMSCKSIQDNIFKMLLPSQDEKIFVGTFGNPDVSEMDDWVEVLHDAKISQNEEDTFICNLVLNVQVQIAYAAVGPFTHPQYKVVGILYKYDSPQVVDFSASDGDLLEEKSLHVSVSVNFYDVSESATEVYRSVPVLSAKLPRDFFYPFLLSSVNHIHTSHALWILTVILFIL